MDLYYDRAEIVINLDNLKHNINIIKKSLPNDSLIMAIVKTDAYGHGASAIASYLEPLKFIWGFGVATVEEGVTLRRFGITKPILVLGATFPGEIQKSVSFNLTNNIFDYNTARMLSEEALRQNKFVNFHISIDSGMGRLGFRDIDSDLEIVKKITNLSNINIEGLFTHFAKADESSDNFTLNQIEYFNNIISKLENIGIKDVIKHCSNSAGIINKFGTSFNMVRAGIMMYGLAPMNDFDSKEFDIKPILSLKSKVIYVKKVPKDTTVSYGATFVSDCEMTIATIPIGYGDGYPRSLSSLGYVLIRGQKAPILGRVCMDQFMVDVTGIKDTEIGDEVTIIGSDSNNEITVDELSQLSGRFNYEFVCDLNKRIPRGYYIGEKRVSTLDYFDD